MGPSFLTCFIFSLCTIAIDDCEIARAELDDSTMAKQAAAELAMKQLKQVCYTIKVVGHSLFVD